jgi:hypothetical protein
MVIGVSVRRPSCRLLFNLLFITIGTGTPRAERAWGSFKTKFMKYIIISPKEGSGKSPVFWKAGNAGYTTSPFAAGIYDEEEIKARPDYYNNGYSAVAIPLTEEAMSKLNFTCSYEDKALDMFLQVAKK